MYILPVYYYMGEYYKIQVQDESVRCRWIRDDDLRTVAHLIRLGFLQPYVIFFIVIDYNLLLYILF